MDEARIIALDVGHQQVSSIRIPGESIRSRPDGYTIQQLAADRIQDQDSAGAARRREYKVRCSVGTQDATSLWAVWQRPLEAEALCINDLDRVIGGVSDKYAASGDVHVAVVESSGGVGWQCDLSLENEHVGLLILRSHRSSEWLRAPGVRRSLPSAPGDCPYHGILSWS
jgi:hypothetical protein